MQGFVPGEQDDASDFLAKIMGAFELGGNNLATDFPGEFKKLFEFKCQQLRIQFPPRSSKAKRNTR